jgi:hypothetical protein
MGSDGVARREIRGSGGRKEKKKEEEEEGRISFFFSPFSILTRSTTTGRR